MKKGCLSLILLLSLIAGLVSPFPVVYADGPDSPEASEGSEETPKTDPDNGNVGEGGDNEGDNSGDNSGDTKPEEKPTNPTPSEPENPNPTNPNNSGSNQSFISGSVGAGSNRYESSGSSQGSVVSPEPSNPNSQPNGSNSQPSNNGSNSSSPSNSDSSDQSSRLPDNTAIDDNLSDLNVNAPSSPLLEPETTSGDENSPTHGNLFENLSALIWIFVAVVAGIIVLVSLTIFLVHRFSHHEETTQ